MFFFTNKHFPVCDEVASPKRVRVLQNISIQPAMTVEERILKELTDLKKRQESFESRIENKLETYQEQLRMQSKSKSREKGSGQGHSQMRGSNYSLHQPRTQNQFQSRQRVAKRHRDQARPERFIDDYEEFEELDKSFPVPKVAYVDELELSIRRDVDFKFLLVI